MSVQGSERPEASPAEAAPETLLKQPEEPRRYLVYTSAGDHSSVHRWLSARRHFDLWVTYYGNRRHAYIDSADYYNERKGAKYQNLHHAYGRWPEVFGRYEAIMVADDDLIISARKLDHLFAVRNAFDYLIVQPAFNPWGKISHAVTRVNRLCTHRETSFIENNCPVFRRDVLDRFMGVYDPVLVGWGIDWWFLHVIGPEREGRLAVIDSASCTNPFAGAKGGREIDRVQSAKARMAVWDQVRERHGIASDPSSQREYKRYLKPAALRLAWAPASWAESALFLASGRAARVYWRWHARRRIKQA